MSRTSTPEIAPARPDDFAAIADLVRQASLPVDGLREQMGAALVARTAGETVQVVGAVALELYGREALLRSLVVASAWRGRGLGLALAQAALALARSRGVERVFLLTETAAGFFPRLGFEPVERSAIPASVQQSVEIRSACPASALAMASSLSVTGSRGTP
ncbi:MAG TPA: arsenic resistance N-acetyltransferase ArsN2 [Thermoanaerobaculia bacterium]|nr:arsenic resistance N-acetyltransferase ArsN2 [Thermoanaerobaculia bacterium]